MWTMGIVSGNGEYQMKPTRNRGARRLSALVARLLVTLTVLATGTLVFANAASADAIPGGKLFAGGAFTEAGGTTATRIAAWNGVNWSALVGPNGEGADGTVFSMTMYNGKLIVGGSFLEAGGEVVSGIATWNGTNWEPLVGSTGGIGVSILPIGFVSALAVYNGDLYVGGLFQTAGGVRRQHRPVERHRLVPGDRPVRFRNRDQRKRHRTRLRHDRRRRSADHAGEFTSAGGVAANSVAAWNGSTWFSVGQPIANLTILAVENFNGRLVAARGYSEDNFFIT